MSKSDEFLLFSRERIELEIEENEKVTNARIALREATYQAIVEFLTETIETADWNIGGKGIISIHFYEMAIKKSLVDLVQEAKTDSTNDEDDIESLKSTLLQCLDILKDR